MTCGIKPWYPIDIIKIIVVEGRSNMLTIACRTFIQTAVRMTVKLILFCIIWEYFLNIYSHVVIKMIILLNIVIVLLILTVENTTEGTK